MPKWVDANWKQLITTCWSGESSHRPSFEQIIVETGKNNFITPGVDRKRFADYQRKVVPANLHDRPGGPAVPPRPAAPPKTLLQRLIEAAEGGDTESQHRSAMRLRNGEGVPQDVQKAAKFFEPAADKGLTETQTQYGLLLEGGRGFGQNLTEAAWYYKMACDKEHPFGIFCYADMLEFGKGVKKDEPQAARLYKKAAYLRHDVSQTRYGLILEKGKFGVKTDLKEAVRSYKTASDQGSPEGMFNFADMLEFGKGVPKNPNAAIQLYKLAAQKGHSKSVAYLRFLMTQGVIMPRDIKAGQTLLVALAEAGEKPLAGAYMLKAAVFLLIGEGGVKKDSVF